MALRIDFIKDEIENNLISVLENMYRPKEIEMMLKQEDLEGTSVLQHIAE